MADPSEDKIDFKKLERELEAAVESDAHYWRENDAKMRAVEQRVETYEQFRDMVAAAHIKPLDKDDKLGMMSGRNQPWNPYYSKEKDGHQKPKAGSQQPDKDPCVLPTNSNDFTKQWRKLKENPQKYTFLINIGSDKLAKIFHAEISFGLLGDILTILNQCLEQSDFDTVVHILTCLAETNRFSLSLDFLSKTEKLHCSELIHKLESYMANGAEAVTDVEGGPDEMGSVEEHQENENSSNSNTNEVKSAPKKEQTSTNTTATKPLVDKETVAKIKGIYKVLPLGR